MQSLVLLSALYRSEPLATWLCQTITICWKCCFTLVDTADLFGVTLNDSLNFGKHITKISKKVGNLLDVPRRLKKISSFPTKRCLYNSFIMSHSRYSITVWSLIAKNWMGCTNDHCVTYTVMNLLKVALFMVILVTALWIDVSRTC